MKSCVVIAGRSFSDITAKLRSSTQLCSLTAAIGVNAGAEVRPQAPVHADVVANTPMAL